MYKRIIIFFSFIIMLCSHASSQGLRSLVPRNEATRLVIPLQSRPTQKVRQVQKVKGHNMPAQSKIEPAYALYRNVIRRYSWIEGLGEPISQEVANHLPCYFRFSLKNNKGHWQHVQAMKGNSRTTHHGKSTYILDAENDTTKANEEWRNKLSTICQWYIISDLSGENVAEERAYDNEGYMIYGFQPVKNGKNSVICSYINDYGLPVDINESENYTYGNVVMITYDHAGRDSIVDYLDGAGYRRLNNDGVDERRYEYDSKDRVIMKTSNNCVGDRIYDNWGNSGVKYTYDDADNSYTITVLNKYLEPMRMPSERAGKIDTYICCKVELDRWGRIIQRTFLDDNGKDDTTDAGIHRVVYQYSDDGSIGDVKYYDINNNLMNI